MEAGLSNGSVSNIKSPQGIDRISMPQLPGSRSSDSALPEESLGVSSELPSFATLKHAEQSGQQITISDEQVLKAIEKAMKALAGKTTTLQFSIHERTKQITVKVLDQENGEVIREIPPEKNLDFLANLWEKAGILVDERR